MLWNDYLAEVSENQCLYSDIRHMKHLIESCIFVAYIMDSFELLLSHVEIF